MPTTDQPDFAALNIQQTLAAHPPVSVSDSKLIPAAVLIPILGSGQDRRVLFTVRTSRVEHHKGEVSFPGGARDPEDQTLETTALRETHEEVGVLPDDVTILGRMSDHESRSGFVVTPFIGTVVLSTDYDPSGAEVADLLEVPLANLWDRYRAGPDMFSYGAGPPSPAYEFHHDGHRIWGLTARMLVDFLVLMDTDLP
jgi:8-oxo-dGTP pyrophosphatase MutT (NUDIX family)